MSEQQQNITTQEQLRFTVLPEMDVDPRQVAEGWTPYSDLGSLYCSGVYPRENDLPRPVSMLPITPRAFAESGAVEVTPKHDSYLYTLGVKFEKENRNNELLTGEKYEEITEVQGIEIPTIGFEDILYGEKEFKKMGFVNGELWRIARIGKANEDPRLAIPHIQFNPNAVQLIAQMHHFSNNGVVQCNQEPKHSTYAPMAGIAEEFVLKVRKTPSIARVTVTSNFLGI